MKFSEFIKEMFTAQSGISSKRVCGTIGWLFAIGWITYYIAIKKEIPDIVEVFIISTVVMLGVDTLPKTIDSYRNKKKGGSCDANNKEI